MYVAARSNALPQAWVLNKRRRNKVLGRHVCMYQALSVGPWCGQGFQGLDFSDGPMYQGVWE